MSEFLPEVAVDMWADAIKEVKARRASMAWARDKLRRLKRNLEYCASACKDIEMALDEETNPMLKKGDCSSCGGRGFVESEGFITNYCGKCQPKGDSK